MTSDQEIIGSLLDLEKTSPEIQVKRYIDVMQSKLSDGSPQFREFWEAKRACLPLFKENLPSTLRGELWRRYVDLSAEAKRLKAILEEESLFASEQIELAIESLVSDLDAMEDRLSQMPGLDVVLELSSIAAKKEEYSKAQKQLHLLNALAAKVNALRKETIKTDMRVRSKNKMFKQLSTCGDRIFPARKELIKKMSEEFLGDIGAFVKMYFEVGRRPSVSIHSLREEVKNLQSLAKLLTLNTGSFTETRIALSFCWDQLKSWDKERKQERAELKSQQKQSYEEAVRKVKEFEEFCLKSPPLHEVLKQHDEVLNVLKGLKDLGSFEWNQLKTMLSTCKHPFEEREREQKEAILSQEKEKESSRLAKIQAVRTNAQKLLENVENMSLEEVQASRSSIEETIRNLTLTKSEKMSLDHFMKQLKDSLLEVKSKRILSLSGSDQEKYEELLSVLQEKRTRRSEVKLQLETYRKALGGSGFDFEKAMMYKELIEAEREVLGKMNSAIEELEEKMAQIEG
jgi:hypothetical protein